MPRASRKTPSHSDFSWLISHYYLLFMLCGAPLSRIAFLSGPPLETFDPMLSADSAPKARLRLTSS